MLREKRRSDDAGLSTSKATYGAAASGGLTTVQIGLFGISAPCSWPQTARVRERSGFSSRSTPASFGSASKCAAHQSTIGGTPSRITPWPTHGGGRAAPPERVERPPRWQHQTLILASFRR